MQSQDTKQINHTQKGKIMSNHNPRDGEQMRFLHTDTTGRYIHLTLKRERAEGVFKSFLEVFSGVVMGCVIAYILYLGV